MAMFVRECSIEFGCQKVFTDRLLNVPEVPTNDN